MSENLRGKVAVTTQFAATVPEMPDAWAFVMSHLELCGPDPHVSITPQWVIARSEYVEGMDVPRSFKVVVKGTTLADHKIESL
jgi:hypothetical protein